MDDSPKHAEEKKSDTEYLVIDPIYTKFKDSLNKCAWSQESDYPLGDKCDWKGLCEVFFSVSNVLLLWVLVTWVILLCEY